MLLIICIALVLHLGHATGEAHVLIWTRWGLWQQLVATWAECQNSMVYYATDQCWKRLETCINAEGGHSEHLLWHCSPDIPVATITTGSFWSHRQQPTTGCFQSLQRLKQCNIPSVRWKNFAIHKLVWWHFQVGWTSVLQFVFFWDNVSNQMHVWIILLKMTFWISQGKVATADKWGGQTCKIFMSNFLRI